MALDLRRIQIENEDLKNNLIALGYKVQAYDDKCMDVA
jgi:hypothetical protein